MALQFDRLLQQDDEPIARLGDGRRNGEIPIAVEGRAYGVELFVRRLRTQGLFGG